MTALFQIIPFNVSDYGLMLSEFVNNMDRQLNATNGLIDALGNANYTKYLANVRGAIGRFQTAADNLQQYVTVKSVLAYLICFIMSLHI